MISSTLTRRSSTGIPHDCATSTTERLVTPRKIVSASSEGVMIFPSITKTIFIVPDSSMYLCSFPSVQTN